MKLKKIIFPVIALAVIAAAAIYFFGSSSDDYYEDDYDDYYEDDYDYDYEEYNYESNKQNKPVSSVTSKNTHRFSSLGSAAELKGNTVIVTIFADDKKTFWGNNSESLKNDTLKYLTIATNWLAKNAENYGSQVNFIYDWQKNPDLYYAGKINTVLTSDDMDGATWKYIDSTIDTAGLMEKYNAQNILYLCMVNTPSNNSITSCTTAYTSDLPYQYEICYMYVNLSGKQEPPSAYAHEILHTFGAPDLYMEDTDGYNFGITKEYVSWCKKNSSNDIMYTIYDRNDKPVYNSIINEFTELDAYYVGLSKKSDEVQKWKLGRTQH